METWTGPNAVEATEPTYVLGWAGGLGFGLGFGWDDLVGCGFGFDGEVPPELPDVPPAVAPAPPDPLPAPPEPPPAGSRVAVSDVDAADPWPPPLPFFFDGLGCGSW
jgi:hypothetical protein